MVTEQDLIESKDEIEELEELQEEKKPVVQALSDVGIELNKGITDYVMSDYEAVNTLSKNLNINATEARKQLSSFPNQYLVGEESIPELVKKMRKARRQLKGEDRLRMSKAIDTVIDGYSDHISKCIDSIYWLTPYREPLLKMRFNEKDLMKLHKIGDVDSRRRVVDSLCKFWEHDLKKTDMVYCKDYSTLEKACRLAKKDFRAEIKKISDQSLAKSKKEKVLSFINTEIRKNPGIGLKQIHERMPNQLNKSTTTNMISKMIKKLDVSSVNGGYYSMPSEIKKNIWAYTAAFIDSDGYITMDRNHNPRVGLIATGDRGRVFMEEMHKSIGFGKLHLNQKSPQDTRPVQRLNFYSQNDVNDLLMKCLPHFRLKKGNAELLLELIRMKKSYKKQEWYKPRCDEIFKLMKWENHRDHVGFDWGKEGIDLDNIQKYKDNCKMSAMDSMEQVGTILKEKRNPSNFYAKYMRETREAMNKTNMPDEMEQQVLSFLEAGKKSIQAELEGNVPFMTPAFIKERIEEILRQYGISERQRFERKNAME
jgi:hypothetical protein